MEDVEGAPIGGPMEEDEMEVADDERPLRWCWCRGLE
jgi:hypothetical protein